MPRILISLIGKGQLPRDNSPRTRSGYVRTEYDFGGGRRTTTAVFGLAAYRHLAQVGRPADAWLVLGTAGSSWTTLADEFDPAADEFDSYAEWSDRVNARSKSDPGAVTADDLAAGAPMLAKGLSVPGLRLELIPECLTRPEQQALMGVLLRHVGEGDRVVMDITHAYRHLPVLLTFMLANLRWLRDAEVEQVLYGKLEGKPPGAPAPVADLSLCAEQARLGGALATYELTGRHAALADLFPDLRDDLERVSFLEGLNCLTQARSPARRLWSALERPPADPFAAAVAERLRPATAWSQGDRLARRMLDRARFLRERREFLPAVLLLYEAVIEEGDRRLAVKPEKPNERAEQSWKRLVEPLDARLRIPLFRLRTLRNTLAHAGDSATPEVTRAMQDPAEMAKLFDEALAAAETILPA
jgi:cell division protein DivIC